jgi:heptosyltransferase-3
MRRLLIRPGAIGDLLVSLPALEFLRADYTEVWVRERNVPLVRFADAAHSIESTGLDLLEFGASPRLIERLRSFDSIVSWYGSNQPQFRDAAARLGLPFQFLPALPENAQLHAMDFYLQQVGARHCSPKSLARQPPENFAVIHPFASNPAKRWPLWKFQEVARGLATPVCWCAGPEEELAGAVRIANLHELGQWLARARLYIGNDSGISHLAAHVGTPSIVLFGPTDPAVWAPLGSRVMYPMEAIQPSDVIAAAESQL